MSPLLRPERRQHLLSRAYRGLQVALGPAGARRAAALHAGLDAEAGYQAFLSRREAAAVPVPPPTSGPLVSLLVPVYQAPERFLAEALESVMSQTYAGWEVCAADGGPPGSPGSRRLAAFAARDPRIRVVALDRNRGIAGNSNAALREARGDYVAFLDQDDLLAKDALATLVARLLEQPDLDVVYSDKDNVTPWGERYAPYFKPDWSPELFLSSNYVSHLCLVRRELIEVVGGFDEALDGAQDWDLLLRVSERTSRIGHVPRVLYHWRSLPTSCASDLDVKPYARDAQRRAVQAHLDRRGVSGRVEVGSAGLLRVIPRIARAPRLTVVTNDASAEIPGGRAYGDVAVVRDAAEADGELMLFWDVRCRPLSDQWLSELAFWALQPGVGSAGALVRRADGRIAEVGLAAAEGRTLPLFAGASDARWTPLGLPLWYRNVLAPTPAAFITRRDVFERLGGLGTGPLDYALRLGRAGLRCVAVPTANVVGLSSPPQALGGVDRDPYFNPNLSPDSPLPRPQED